MPRLYLLLTLACALLLLFGCDSGSSEPEWKLANEDHSPFPFTDTELEAMRTGDESALVATFGEPGLGTPSVNQPPTGLGLPVLHTEPEPSKESSTWKQWNSRCHKHKKTKCHKCYKPCGCTGTCKPIGLCNLTELFNKTADCCTETADVTYKARVYFDNSRCDKAGAEVVFLRNGAEVGRAETDSQGFVKFTERGVGRDGHVSTICIADGFDPAAPHGDDCATCPSKSKSSSAVLSNPGVDWRDWNLPCDDCDFEGELCASRDFAVFSDCVEGSVTGKGYIDSCDPRRQGLRAFMQFRAAVKDGQIQGLFNYRDGGVAVIGAQLVDEPVEWVVFAGRHAWFGNGSKWMAHAYDGGANFWEDSINVKIWRDCDTYCCGGNLVGCYVKTSYKFTADCP